MFNNKNYIFIFTITPVQSFISQARKTRDLYAGSQILSQLTKKAIEVAKEQNAEIIIPNVDIEKAHSISNKFVAVFNNIDEENLETIGKNIEFNTLLYWKNEIANKTLEKIKNKTVSNQNDEFLHKFNDHITKYFNIYWLFYPVENDNYQVAYKEAEKYLGAIKNVRYFQQFDTEERYRKCSICGERDAIVYKNIKFVDKNKTEPAYAYKNSLLLKNSYLIEENEGLCGICFVKRFYQHQENTEYFPSTVKIALLSLLNYEEIEKSIEKYKENFHDCWNDQFLIEENLNKRYLEKQGCKEIDIQKAKKELKEIYEIVKEKGFKISKYYALIKFDGDSMGKWLSGEFLDDKSKLREFHECLSCLLSDFAKHSKDYLDGDNKGKTVYAGGDDFLGFINLQYLFDVMETLREDFRKKVSQPLKEKFNLEKELTFSAGIVIAHYKDPLSLVLSWVNKMEEEAKNIDDNKDAFGIAVLKRSGEIRKAVYKWEKLKHIKEIYEKVVKQKEFNSSFISKLEAGFRKMPVESNEFLNKSGDFLIEADLKRVLRKSSNIKDKKILKEKIDCLIPNLFNLISEKPTNFFEILNILKFLEREL